MSREATLVGALVGAAALAAVVASFAAAPGWSGLAGAALAVAMTAIAVVDARWLAIPDELNAIAGALALIAMTLETWPEAVVAGLDAAIRAAAAAAIFFAFRAAYRAWRGREGMGLGDVKLAGVAGLWLDWPSLPIAVEVAALGALSFVAVRQWRAGVRPDPLAKLPFGAFFAPAIWFAWLLQTQLR